MMKLTYGAAALAVSAALMSTSAAAVEVNTLDGSQGWQVAFATAGGVTELAPTTGGTPNLANDAPLPDGAVRLQTPNDNNARAEIKREGNYGQVRDLFDGDLSLTYSWYNAPGSGTTAAPALKISIFNPTFTGDGFGQLIYEPYAQGSGLNTIVIPEDEWVTETISLTDGLFWDTSLLGTSNHAGGPPYQTLQDYLTDPEIDQAAFADSFVTSIAVGLGSFNPSVSSFTDNVKIAGTLLDGEFDFQAAVVPLPAALPMAAAAFGVFGFIGWRRRVA